MLAFAKIMKKYDKVTRYNLSRVYVKEVESSYFATSAKVSRHPFPNYACALYHVLSFHELAV